MCLFPPLFNFFFSRTLESSGSCPWGYAYPSLAIAATDEYRHSNLNYATTTTAPQPFNSLFIPTNYSMLYATGLDSVAGVATRCGLDGTGIESPWERHFSHPSRPALRPTQPPVQSVQGLFPEGKAAGDWC
jgi:hypothetical protein